MNMQELSSYPIRDCRKDSLPLIAGERDLYMVQLPEWSLIDFQNMPVLERCYKFENFAAAMAFTNRVGKLAEMSNHHPALVTEWGKVTVCWWTHIISGLHLNDFIMAARCDKVFNSSAKN